jgi:FkbM family methyltransferase
VNPIAIIILAGLSVQGQVGENIHWMVYKSLSWKEWKMAKKAPEMEVKEDNGIPARLMTNKYVAIKKCKHGVFLYNRNDTVISRSLDIYGEWGEHELEVLSRLIKPGYVVIDIGANLGTYSIFFAEQVGPTGLVYSLEPQRITYEFLCANIVLNCFTNVIPLQMAVGEKAEIIQIPALDPTKPADFSALRMNGHHDGEMVQVVRLDDLSFQQCDLIKINVEGMESGVLRGAIGLIKNLRPLIFCANKSQTGSPDLVRILMDLNYDCWWHIASSYNPNNFFHNQENVWLEHLPEANMICIPRELGVEINWTQPVTGPNDNWVDALGRMNVNVIWK